MAKVELTLEELKERKIRRSNGWTRFWAIVLAFVLVAGVTGVAYKQADTKNAEIEEQLSEIDEQAAAQQSFDGAATDNNSATPNGGADANAPASDEATAAAKAINDATATAANAGYDWARKCDLEKIDVGNATDTINGIIKRVDPNADLNSVVGGFIGRGDKKNTNTAGADPKEIFGNANYKLKATSLQAGDLQGLKVEGDTYTFKLADASNPQKDGGTSLNRLTDDFITQDEVAQGIKDGLGALSALVSVKSSDVVFQNIEVTVVIKEGKLESLSYKYDMVVNKLALNVATGVGNGYVDASYSNFVY